MTTGLRVLVVSPDLPYPPSWGSGMRILQLTRHLARENHVTLLCYGRPDQLGDLDALRQQIGGVQVVARPPVPVWRHRGQQTRSLVSRTPHHAVRLWSRHFQQALDDLLALQDFDVVQVETSPMTIFRYNTQALLVLNEHNIESEVLRRMGVAEQSRTRSLYNKWEHRRYLAFESRAWSRVDACLVTSEREVDSVMSRAPETRTEVIPNAVDPTVFAPSGESTDPDSLLFTGLLTHRPNLEGLEFFLREIFPHIRAERPTVTLRVVGYGEPRDLERLRGPGVEVTGLVPELQPYLSRAAVVVVPLRMGGGTRLKVLEALSSGKPVVSTHLGCEGLSVRDGEHVLLADDPRAFASQVTRLLDDATLCAALGAAGRALVSERYTWERAGQALQQVYAELVANRRDASTDELPHRQDRGPAAPPAAGFSEQTG